MPLLLSEYLSHHFDELFVNIFSSLLTAADAIPLGTSFVPGSVTGAAGNPPLLTLLAPLAAGGTVVITYQVKVGAVLPSPNPVPNTASTAYQYTIDPAHPDGGIGNAGSGTVTTLVNNAALDVAIAVDKTYTDLGTVLTYTLTATNTGNTPANNVVLSSAVPAGTTLVPGSITGGTGTPAALALAGPVPAGGTSTATYQVLVGNNIPSPNPMPNTVNGAFQYTIDPANPNTASGTAAGNTVDTTVNTATLAVAIAVDKAYTDLGTVLTYTLTATNTGNVPADNVVLSSAVPAGATYVPGSITGGTGTPAALTLAGPVPAGGTSTATYQVLVGNTIPSPNPMPNTVNGAYQYTVDPAAPDAASGTAAGNTVDTLVNHAAITATKAVSEINASPYDVLTYTITLQNTGNVPADSVKVTDFVPAGTAYVPGSLSPNATGAPPVITLIAPIPVGGSATITFQAKVGNRIPDPNPMPNIANVAFKYTVDPAHPDGASGTAVSNEVTTFVAAPLLTIVKKADKDIAFLGDVITYTITVDNTGNLPADLVKITDAIPAGLTYLPGSITANVGISGDPTSTIDLLAPIPVSGHVVITFKATVTSIPPLKQAINTATIVYSYTKDPAQPDGVTVTTISNMVKTCLHTFNFMQPATDLVESIALQETALSHILNAEGEKIQAALAIPNVTAQQLLAVNSSVQDTISAVANLEIVLQNKAKTVRDQITCG